MHKSGFLALISLSYRTLVAAQKDKQAYCDPQGKVPRLDSCMDIKNNGVSDSGSYGRNEWWSGNCRVEVTGDLTNSLSIGGTELKEAIQNIIDTCDVGFEYTSGVRVDVNLCTVPGQQGIEPECNSPLQEVKGFPFRKRDEVEDIFYRRRHLTDVPTTLNPNHVFSRQTGPWEGLICGGGPGSAFISACNELADEILSEHPEFVDLPLKKFVQDCEVQAWPTNRDTKNVHVPHVTLVMKDDAAACADATGEIIGFVEDYNGYVNEGEYHLFFGRFCGRLNSGSGAGCFSGGRI